jgi:NAD(P)H dehydrogenase (quinone)
MRCLVVVVHPSPESLCGTLAAQAVETLQASGHEVIVEDLYAQDFHAALTREERASYYTPTYRGGAVQAQMERLLAAEAMVLCFPTWWFGFPAVLKGWFDRVWAPGIAYDHANDLGPIQPRLNRLRKILVVTSLGSPFWVDLLVMRRPVKRVLQTAILGVCAPGCNFKMLSLYRSERLTPEQVRRFRAKVARTLEGWK